MILAFERRVEEHYIDLDKMALDGKIDREIEGSPNGYYTCVIVPSYLKDKKVVIMPLTDDDKILKLDENVKMK